MATLYYRLTRFECKWSLFKIQNHKLLTNFSHTCTCNSYLLNIITGLFSESIVIYITQFLWSKRDIGLFLSNSSVYSCFHSFQPLLRSSQREECIPVVLQAVCPQCPAPLPHQHHPRTAQLHQGLALVLMVCQVSLRVLCLYLSWSYVVSSLHLFSIFFCCKIQEWNVLSK